MYLKSTHLRLQPHPADGNGLRICETSAYKQKNHISSAQTEAHFTNDLSIVIKIRKKFHLTIILFLVISPLHIFPQNYDGQAILEMSTRSPVPRSVYLQQAWLRVQHTSSQWTSCSPVPQTSRGFSWTSPLFVACVLHHQTLNLVCKFASVVCNIPSMEWLYSQYPQICELILIKFTMTCDISFQLRLKKLQNFN